MVCRFEARVWFWKGPAPFYFLSLPEKEAAEVRELQALVTYGWGMIPAEVAIGDTVFRTALWPKDGTYAVPLKASVRKAERLNEGDLVQATITVE